MKSSTTALRLLAVTLIPAQARAAYPQIKDRTITVYYADIAARKPRGRCECYIVRDSNGLTLGVVSVGADGKWDFQEARAPYVMLEDDGLLSDIQLEHRAGDVAADVSVLADGAGEDVTRRAEINPCTERVLLSSHCWASGKTRRACLFTMGMVAL